MRDRQPQGVKVNQTQSTTATEDVVEQLKKLLVFHQYLCNEEPKSERTALLPEKSRLPFVKTKTKFQAFLFSYLPSILNYNICPHLR